VSTAVTAARQLCDCLAEDIAGIWHARSGTTPSTNNVVVILMDDSFRPQTEVISQPTNGLV